MGTDGAPRRMSGMKGCIGWNDVASGGIFKKILKYEKGRTIRKDKNIFQHLARSHRKLWETAV